MANKITCDDLQILLMKHLKGTALELIAENKDYITNYITDPDGFVATQTIDNLCDAFLRIIRIHEILNPRRKPETAQNIVKIRQTIEALQSFKTNTQHQ